MLRALPFFLFFLSGFSSLVYEVVWSRMMVLVFGNTTQATSIILSSFMGGLALGGYLLGRYSSLWRKSPLTLFGLLELATGFYAILFPLLLRFVAPVEIWISGLGPGHYTLTILRGILCFSLILPPTLMMGGTFAVLGRHLIRSQDELGGKSALLYGVNTVGAVLGAGLTGFFLLKHLGNSGSLSVAAGINALAGACALWIGRAGAAGRSEQAGSSVSGRPNSDAPVALIMIALAISGFCGLGYEVLWTRLLLLVVDNSIYSFTAILVVFLCGIAFGSLSLAPLARRFKNLTLLFGLSQLGIGLLAYYFPAAVQIRSVQGTVHYYAFLCQAIFVMVFVPAALMGMALPLSLWIRGGGPADAARRIGRMFAVNTLGAVLGGLVTGFLLIPFLGLQKTSLLLPVLNWLTGGALVWRALKGSVRIGYSAGLAVLLVVGLLLSPGDLVRKKHGDLAGGGRMVFYKEGRAATTTIIDRPGGERILFLNGIPQVRNDPTSMKTFKIMGALPCLLQEKPKRGLAITFGAGITSGVMAGFLESLDCVELVDEAPEIATYFSVENGDVLKRKNVRLHIDDARHFLLTNPKGYDVIVADATHPRGYDSWVLFTKEFYELLKRRLEPGGVFVQWVPFHGMTLEQYMAIARTFQTVFPNSSIWSIDRAHSILLGRAGSEKMDFGRMLNRMSEGWAKTNLKPVGLEDPLALLSHFCMGKSGMERMLAKFPGVITDDSPRHLFFPVDATFGEQYGQWPEENSRFLAERAESVVPYLSNVGDSEEQRTAILRRLQTPRRNR